MKKIVFIVAGCLFFSFAFAQDKTTSTEANTKTLKLSNRSSDHFMIQLSSDHWSGMPDSIKSHQSGFSRGFSAYVMLDKPFRSSPKYSIGFGAGISSDNMFFSKMNVNITSPSTMLPFTATDSSNHFKKYKLTTTYAEIPLEFRYTSRPESSNKSFKAAAGIKVGTLIGTHTKGKTLQDKNNNTINSISEKEVSTRFTNGTRLLATARVGYGILSVFGSYQLNNVLKDGAGPDMKLYQVGITISGL